MWLILTCFLISDPFMDSHILSGGWTAVVAAELNLESALQNKKGGIVQLGRHIIAISILLTHFFLLSFLRQMSIFRGHAQNVTSNPCEIRHAAQTEEIYILFFHQYIAGSFDMHHSTVLTCT